MIQTEGQNQGTGKIMRFVPSLVFYMTGRSLLMSSHLGVTTELDTVSAGYVIWCLVAGWLRNVALSHRSV